MSSDKFSDDPKQRYRGKYNKNIPIMFATI